MCVLPLIGGGGGGENKKVVVVVSLFFILYCDLLGIIIWKQGGGKQLPIHSLK